MTITDPEAFMDKGKPIIYIKAFVELYNWRNRGQVHEIHGIVKLEKMRASRTEHPRNLGAHYIVERSSILHSAHIILRDQERILFYVNNYINWNQFNQLYASDSLEKVIQNADAVAQKLTPALIKATNLKKKEVRKK